MTQSIMIRLKGYGDDAALSDVAEIILPEGFSTVKSLKIVTVPGRSHKLESAFVEFEKGAVG